MNSEPQLQSLPRWTEPTNGPHQLWQHLRIVRRVVYTGMANFAPSRWEDPDCQDIRECLGLAWPTSVRRKPALANVINWHVTQSGKAKENPIAPHILASDKRAEEAEAEEAGQGRRRYELMQN